METSTLDGVEMIVQGDRTLEQINVELQEALRTSDDERFLALQIEAGAALSHMKAGALLFDPESFVRHFAS